MAVAFLPDDSGCHRLPRPLPRRVQRQPGLDAAQPIPARKPQNRFPRQRIPAPLRQQKRGRAGEKPGSAKHRPPHLPAELRRLPRLRRRRYAGQLPQPHRQRLDMGRHAGKHHQHHHQRPHRGDAAGRRAGCGRAGTSAQRGRPRKTGKHQQLHPLPRWLRTRPGACRQRQRTLRHQLHRLPRAGRQR